MERPDPVYVKQRKLTQITKKFCPPFLITSLIYLSPNYRGTVALT